MRQQWTRRGVLALCAAPRLVAATRGQTFAAERVRFADPSTENEVHRLTNPAYASFLPPSFNRSSSSKGGFVIYASDRVGALQAYRLDVRSGESRLLTEAAALDPQTLMLTADERSVAYFDGDELKLTPIGAGRDRTLGRVSEGWKRSRGMSIADDGIYAAWVEERDGKSRLMLTSAGKASVVVEAAGELSIPLIRPKRAGILYRSGNELWLVGFDGSDRRLLKTAPGKLGLAQWSPDGRTVIYLLGNQMREHTPDSNADALLANTSQFASFGRNADASVFVGASRSKAGPYVLLLLRVTHRELALCEHACSNPEAVNPVFSPSSQRIFFQSDRNGKMAIYTMAVEKLVEKTET